MWTLKIFRPLFLSFALSFALVPAAAAVQPVSATVAGPLAQQAQSEVATLLAQQTAAWNRGDLAAFTAAYAEDATFLSPTGVTHGRAQVLDRYRKRYPDPQAMGALTLEILEARVASGAPRVDTVSVAARWRLAYPDPPGKKTAEGLTLIVFHRHGDRWEIVQDASM